MTDPSRREDVQDIHLRLLPDPQESAFEAVYAAHHDATWRCLRALGVPASGIDDATQDVFVIVHRRLPQFDHAAPVRSWILGIARNVARKYRDRERKAPAQLRVLGDEGTSPDEHVRMSEAARLVKEFLDSLEEDQRAVFVLAHLEGMTAPEIASTLGIKVNTAYSRLRLARKRFDKLVARHEARRRRVAP